MSLDVLSDHKMGATTPAIASAFMMKDSKQRSKQ